MERKKRVWEEAAVWIRSSGRSKPGGGLRILCALGWGAGTWGFELWALTCGCFARDRSPLLGHGKRNADNRTVPGHIGHTSISGSTMDVNNGVEHPPMRHGQRGRIVLCGWRPRSTNDEHISLAPLEKSLLCLTYSDRSNVRNACCALRYKSAATRWPNNRLLVLHASPTK